ncbi:helix-turn-helix domain-containing protein [Streptomyces sp. NPDC056387]|uniref:helix-turn-helix domain-containing protein n=1 Tax=Streptomyces sp. NPDC056387 TaxID=3345803 RepID=UPI0035DDCCF3
MGGSETPVAAAYAAALREAVAGFTAAGGTQKAMADALHVSAAALSRYLSGDRIAPRETLRAMQAFLAARGLPCPSRSGRSWMRCAARRTSPVDPRPSNWPSSKRN